MTVLHNTPAQAMTPVPALERLEEAIVALRARHERSVGFESLERELHELFVTAEREVLGEELERMARMPESKKTTLKSMLSAELERVLDTRAELTLVKVADGAKDNWTYLHDALPEGVELVDFFHAVSHLKSAFDTAYGENTPKALAQFKKYRHVLRDDHDGVEKVIRALVYLRKLHPRRKVISTELAYFRGHRHRMRYAEAKACNQPIGSGIVEAACKTLVTQRMKRSGMRWRHDGGQAILTLRSLIQCERFEAGWELLSQTYVTAVTPHNNVVPFPKRSHH